MRSGLGREGESMKPIRVLIADDHPVLRDGLRLLLGAEPGIEVVGEAGNGGEAIVAAAELQPDVVVMDLHMPDVTGIEATRRIVDTSPHIGVLVLTMFDDDESVFAAMRAGARGYLLKGVPQADMSAPSRPSDAARRSSAPASRGGSSTISPHSQPQAPLSSPS